MSFIRLKKRGNENFYAYLVDNSWVKYAPKQKVRLYLGKYIKLDRIKFETIVDPFKTLKKDLFYYLLKQELLNHGFEEKNKDNFIYSNFIINLKQRKVIDKNTNKKVCLGINDGYLCNYTINSLFSFKPKNKDKREGAKLIKLLLDAGISPKKDIFIGIFNKII